MVTSNIVNQNRPAGNEGRFTTRIITTLTALVAGLVLAIGAGAFVLSYDALLAVAKQAGQPAGKAWIWPLLIDAPLVAFTLALLAFQIMREGVKLWAGLVIVYTAATVAFNLSHAPATTIGRLAAVVAPIGLLLTTEALRHLAKTIIDRKALVATLAELRTQAGQLAGDLDTRRQAAAVDVAALERQTETARAKLEGIRAELNQEISRKRAASVTELNAARAAKIDQRRARVLEMLPQYGSRAELAAALGVSEKTLRGDLRALNGRAVAVVGGG